MGDDTHDYAAMMDSLNLRYQVRPAQTPDLDRLLELVQRTNQFNTTTRRRTTSEIKDLLSAEDKRVYVASLRDRFGALGVVAVAIFDLAKQAGSLRAGGNSIFDETDVSKAAFHASLFGKLLGVEYDGIMRDYGKLAKAKALLVDFDNTLNRGTKRP
jgi:predicted enzyme involved in methoxymalonyl-ACP biosynthesis